MKRSDMTPGQDYLVSTSNTWADGTGYGRPTQMTVLDTRFWGFRSRFAKTAAEAGTPTTHTVDLENGQRVVLPITYELKDTGRAGPNVLVLDVKTNRVAQIIPAHIRGPWAEAKATYDSAAAERQERARAKNAQRQAATAHLTDLEVRLTDRLGPNMIPPLRLVGVSGVHGLTLTALQAIVDALDS